MLDPSSSKLEFPIDMSFSDISLPTEIIEMLAAMVHIKTGTRRISMKCIVFIYDAPFGKTLDIKLNEDFAKYGSHPCVLPNTSIAIYKLTSNMIYYNYYSSSSSSSHSNEWKGRIVK